MKKILLAFIFWGILISTNYGQSQDSVNLTTKEYMTIIGEFYNRKLNTITISDTDGKFIKLTKSDFSSNIQDVNTTEILKLLKDYSDKGWSINSSNMICKELHIIFYYFLERKEKNKSMK